MCNKKCGRNQDTDNLQPLKGRFELNIINAHTGEVIENYVDPNLVVNGGRTAVMRLLGSGDASKQLTKLSVGTNGTAPVGTDTAITGTGTVGDTFTVGGDIASCVLNARQFQANRYLITMSGTSIGTTNYKVNMASESMSSDANWVNDVNFREPLFKKISATQFYLIVDEDDSGFSQNIKVHFDVISLV